MCSLRNEAKREALLTSCLWLLDTFACAVQPGGAGSDSSDFLHTNAMPADLADINECLSRYWPSLSVLEAQVLSSRSREGAGGLLQSSEHIYDF